MRNKFWFHAVCWIGWLGLAALVTYSSKPEIRVAAGAILFIWVLAVILTGIRYNRKHPGPAGRTFIQRLASSTWVFSFIHLALGAIVIGFIFAFDEANRLQVSILIFLSCALIFLLTVVYRVRKMIATDTLPPEIKKRLAEKAENRE